MTEATQTTPASAHRRRDRRGHRGRRGTFALGPDDQRRDREPARREAAAQGRLLSYRLTIELPGLPPTNTGDRTHRWREIRLKRQWQRAVRLLAARSLPPEPLPHARIVCTRYSAVEPDPENLQWSFKWLIDALQPRQGFPGVIAGDRRDQLERSYTWARAQRGEGRVVLEVFE